MVEIVARLFFVRLIIWFQSLWFMAFSLDWENVKRNESKRDGVNRNKREKVGKMNKIVKKYSIYLEHGIYLTDSVDCC